MTRGTLRLTNKFKNWLLNTPGIADTTKLDGVLESALKRAQMLGERNDGSAQLVRGLSTKEPHAAWSDAHLEDYLVCASLLATKSLDMTPFDTQLLAVANMLRGTVVEMDTGEGKTLVGALVAGAHAVTGRRVHILTVNDYLARRDADWMGPFYAALGVSCAFVTTESTPEQRKGAYACDVVYVSVNELGFDVLRDRTCTAPEQTVLAPFDVCIVDEIDSVLVDEAIVPLVLAGRARSELQSVDVAEFVRGLLPERDFAVAADKRNVSLTDGGIDRAEARWPGVELYSAEGTPLFSSINTALHAQVLLQRDVDYIVRDGAAQIVSDSRGRVATSQRWPDGLQAAVETKEGLTQTEQGEVLDQLLIRDLIKSFAAVTGMSGTAVAVAEYLRTNYELDAGRIPPHKVCVRRDLPEQIYAKSVKRDAAVIEAALSEHATGRPVLIGTHDVATSERLGATLAGQGVACQVLNARNDSLEAQIIAQAGEFGAVTVSTQMAGRGTDILLGGKGSGPAEHAKVTEQGGLLVMIVGRFYSPRLDAQLRGRAGRQGDPGTSVIYSSMEDPSENGEPALGLELLASVAPDADDAGLLTREGLSGLLDRAQRMAEQERFATQENSWKYNELIAYQRRVVLSQRDQILEDDDAALREFSGHTRMGELRDALGESGLAELCRQILLFTIDAHWSDHLALLSEQRAAIHLRALGRQNPLDEYRRESIRAFEGLLARAGEEAHEMISAVVVTDGVADIEAVGVRRASSTWTYVVDENPFGNPGDTAMKWLLKKLGR